jgi:two-component system sensor histidine kinase SenX3
VIVVVGIACLVAGGLAGLLASRRRPTPPRRTVSPEGSVAARPGMDAALAALRTGVVVVDEEDAVVWTNPAADAMRVVGNGRVVAPALSQLVRRVRRDGHAVSADVALPDPREVRDVHVVATPGRSYVALLLDDTTEARRLDAVRRDFVANVSHELKTPVGAMSLLAEAIQGSGDDVETARSFAERLGVESARLSRLVDELIDLSRLQGAEPMDRADAVPVRTFVDEAVDRVRLGADAAGIELVVSVEPADLTVRGDERQLATAVANLLDNAVAYSSPDTRVAVSARPRGDEVDVSVSDQGIGISAADRERVFERFYRVDPARSRETGGTGLGLAIVKHIATNHGGRVDVWSAEGTGSTFTLTLPAGVGAAP